MGPARDFFFFLFFLGCDMHGSCEASGVSVRECASAREETAASGRRRELTGRRRWSWTRGPALAGAEEEGEPRPGKGI